MAGELGTWVADADQAFISQSEQGGEAHSMDVAARSRLWRVDVGVGVEPDDAERNVGSRELGHRAGDGADGNGVVAAEDEGEAAGVENFANGFRECAVDGEDGVDEAQVGASAGDGFGDGDGQVAEVLDIVAESGEACVDTCDAQGGGSHVYAAAARTEVEWDADDADALGQERMHALIINPRGAGKHCSASVAARARRGNRSYGGPLGSDDAVGEPAQKGVADAADIATGLVGSEAGVTGGVKEVIPIESVGFGRISAGALLHAEAQRGGTAGRFVSGRNEVGEHGVGLKSADKVVGSAEALDLLSGGQAVDADAFVELLAVAAAGDGFHEDVFRSDERQLGVDAGADGCRVDDEAAEDVVKNDAE